MLPPEGNVSIMFIGKIPPGSVIVDYRHVTIRAEFQEAPLESLEWQASILTMLNKLASDIRVAAVALRPGVDAAIKQLRVVVTAIKEKAFSVEELGGMSATQRTSLMKSKKGLVTDLFSLLNDLEATVNIGKSDLSSDHLATWLNKARNMRFGARILKRVKTDVTSGGIIQDLQKRVGFTNQSSAQDGTGGKLEAEVKADNASRSHLSGMAAQDHWLEITRAFQNKQNLSSSSFFARFASMTVTELLYAYGMVGRFIDVKRTEASNIDPWVRLL
jgi:hypothetical protein